MALKRLDEEFDLKPGTQLLPYMKRLLPSLEGRFQALETEQKTVDEAIGDMRAVALQRINEILIPATEDIVEVTTLGFLLGPSTSSVLLEIGEKIFTITEGPQRDTFTPSPYVIVERQANIDDYAIARVQYYTRETGALSLYLTAVHGNPGPHTDWVISSTPGMANSTKLYHDAVAPMHDQVAADHAEVVTMHAEILAAAEALEESGLDVNAFIRRDGTVPFIATQQGVHPPVGSNDATLVTSAWSRARMIEYAGNALLKSGGVMTGPLTLAGAPVNALHAATKAYVDSIVGAGGVVGSTMTIQAVNPAIRLRPTGANQYRLIEAQAVNGTARWTLAIGDNAAETGGDAGSNFSLYRFNDGGTYLDTPLAVNRQTGNTTLKSLTATGLNLNGGATIAGDLSVYRPHAPTSSAIYMNQAGSAYHHFDGGTHQFAGGGISCGNSPITVGHISSYSLNTQGHPITTWGITSHGNVVVNGWHTINGGMTVASAAPIITFQDTDYANMHLHSNQGNIGYLGHQGQWLQYTTNGGHIWSAAYGWMHDYIVQQASAHAWSAADYRYNQSVVSLRWVHAGDVDVTYYYYQLAEIAHAAMTGLFLIGPAYGLNVYAIRYRQLQHHMAGNWYTSGWVT